MAAFAVYVDVVAQKAKKQAVLVSGINAMPRALTYKRLLRLSDGRYPALTISLCRRYLARYPNDGAAWLLLGTALADLARYQDAKQAIQKAADLCPRDKRQIPRAQMGHLFLAAGEYDRAAEWYAKAIKADPDDATYYIYLGAVRAKQGRLRDAERAHRKAVACAIGCIEEAYLNLGFVLRAQERFTEAADCFRKALDLDANYRAARRALRDVEQCIRLT
jgi:tetratricopeptide (TPR) repeat protein